jgi:hypothetical protein
MHVPQIRFSSQDSLECVLLAWRAEVALHQFLVACEPGETAHVARRGAEDQHVEPVTLDHPDCMLDGGSDTNVEWPILITGVHVFLTSLKRQGRIV